MFVHGVVLVHHFSLQHECTHYIAFRTRRSNDVVGAACGFVIIRTGEPKGAPGTRKLRVAEVRTRAGVVELRIGPGRSSPVGSEPCAA